MANSHAKSKKPNKKAIVIIWCAVVAVLATVGILIISQCHGNTGDKLKEVAYPRGYSEYVDAAAAKYQIDPALIYAVIRTESVFDADAGSGAGACGLMQIMPETFEHYQMMRGEEGAYSSEALFDPAINIDYGCYILREHLDTFENEECAVAAYNAGAGSVETWLSDPNISSDGKTLIVDNIPYDETRDYVKKVEETKQVYHELYY